MVTASEMGKKGGSAKSEAKAAAARKNASKPRGKWVTAIAYELDGVAAFKAFGSVIVRGAPPADPAKAHEWVRKALRENGVGLHGETVLDFRQLAVSSRKF